MGPVFLLDPGHGGILGGQYQTVGKRSPVWSDGKVLYEGEFNRAIAERIEKWAPFFDVECFNIVKEQQDIPLALRVERANGYKNVFPGDKCIYVSIHSNAGGGSGIEVFTSIGQTESDEIATIFLKSLNHMFPTVRLRTDESDGDPDKEENYYVLRETMMPAVLTENFFMDNEKECREYLMSEKGRSDIAIAHLGAMHEITQLFKEGRMS